jgi:hypothetical protein
VLLRTKSGPVTQGLPALSTTTRFAPASNAFWRILVESAGSDPKEDTVTPFAKHAPDTVIKTQAKRRPKAVSPAIFRRCMQLIRRYPCPYQP